MSGIVLSASVRQNLLSLQSTASLLATTQNDLSTGNKVSDYVLGNWQLNNIFTTFSGQPFTPIISSDIANTGNVGWAGYEHANIVGNPNAISKRTPAEYFNTAAFVAPPAFTYGTASRNSLRQAPYWNLDASVFRQFPFWGEGRRIEFRGEAFNIFNHPVLGTPNNDLNNGKAFGTVNKTFTGNTSRELQLGAKVIF